MPDNARLAVDQLYQHTDPGQFAFETTADLEEVVQIVGQERALDALRFGIGIDQQGYNLYALGPQDLSKFDAIHRYIEQTATGMEVPPDWVYVYNFDTAHKPNAISLPAGRGVAFRDEMAQLVEELQAVLPATFDSEEFHAQRQAVEEEFKRRQEQAFTGLKEKAEGKGIALVQTPSGLAFAPMKDGEVIDPKDFLSLPESDQEQVQDEVEGLQEDLQKILLQVPQWQKENREKIKTLKEEVAGYTVAPFFESLREKFEQLEEVVSYLRAVETNVIQHVDKFLQDPTDDENPLAAMMRGQRPANAPPTFTEYEVNLMVDNSDISGAPVVHIELPTYQNLIGRVEHVSQMGALITNFTLIKPGALHEANGGFLLLDARKLLQQPYAWEGLKRSLRTRDVAIESLGQMYSLISTVSLEPEPIPLQVKVVLLGERLLYYLLVQHDPEFGELFKVMVDFDDETVRSAANNEALANFIATQVREDDLRPFAREAVARVIEYSARLASDKERLSTHMQRIVDLLREADYWAGESGNGVIDEANVQRAIDAQLYRAGRLRERMQESILRETIFIDTEGAHVGQINGLSVLMLGNYPFGRASRITARVRMGKGEVIDVERRVEMGGPIHSKGVFILSSFIGSRFASERPFSLSASIVFEQSYGGIDGDSASSAELYALLSALSQAPIAQSLAVTGSVNQHGKVQAIGGVNEKIEGFFELCQERGLTGSQGVLIPQSNVKNLMLRQDVREAVAAGQFHIYPVKHVDEGIELLTGLPAGEPDAEGNYPEGTINHKIAVRLDKVARKQRKFNAPLPAAQEASENGNVVAAEEEE